MQEKKNKDAVVAIPPFTMVDKQREADRRSSRALLWFLLATVAFGLFFVARPMIMICIHGDQSNATGIDVASDEFELLSDDLDVTSDEFELLSDVFGPQIGGNLTNQTFFTKVYLPYYPYTEYVYFKLLGDFYRQTYCSGLKVYGCVEARGAVWYYRNRHLTFTPGVVNIDGRMVNYSGTVKYQMYNESLPEVEEQEEVSKENYTPYVQILLRCSSSPELNFSAHNESLYYLSGYDLCHSPSNHTNTSTTTVAPGPTPTSNLPLCMDKLCQDGFKSCQTKYSNEDCLSFAANGYLCSEACDAVFLLKEPPVCQGNLYFSACPETECLKDCDGNCLSKNSNGRCVPRCACPGENQRYSVANDNCIDEDDCPYNGGCSSIIEGDYLSLGAKQTNCSSTEPGSYCLPFCENGPICVEKPAYTPSEEMRQLCGKLNEDQCGQQSGPIPHSHRCFWLPQGFPGRLGPRLYCRNSIWQISDPGDCPSKPKSTFIQCNALRSSACLVQQQPIQQECQTAFDSIKAKCALPCISARNGGDYASCGQCFYSQIEFTQTFGTPNCCGNIVELFYQWQIQQTDAMGIILSQCKAHDPTESDDAIGNDDFIEHGLDNEDDPTIA